MLSIADPRLLTLLSHQNWTPKMPIFTATPPPSLGSVPTHISFLSHLLTGPDVSSSSSSCSLLIPYSSVSKVSHKFLGRRRPLVCAASEVSSKAFERPDREAGQAAAAARALQEAAASPDAIRLARRSADWKAARNYNDGRLIYEGRIEGFNNGGLLVRFRTLVGFLPFPQLSPSHFCTEPRRSPQEVARSLTGSLISVKVIQVDEEKRKLIFSEKEAVWSKFSDQVNIGDIFEGKVGSLEDYGAFVHLRFPDGLYHLTGLVHVSEVSWDLVQDVRDILTEGDEVRVKVLSIDREKARMTLSIKQLEEDPLLETLDKVIPQEGADSSDSLSNSDSSNIEPLPGLETIFEELLKENGIGDVRITRQGFEKRVVSQDLQLWLSNAPATNQKFTLLARAGRQVQEIQLTTSLDQEGIKKALQRVLERVP
ncbi:Polyribonucleotide nucleotidyltransferase [Parasponia andersonii]|uniref:Polyribonucleotide nucleotidyltransferase n=1 Tax=Parasponia andersonii TaxID=3476 RepID=A0A2P5AI64_PARAD|nr:Polyribonucleotide nucleotidyltransferase [Parasponia andersonii]